MTMQGQLLQEPRIATTLVGMASRDVVRQNVEAVMQALELAPNPKAAKEGALLEAVERMFEPVMNTTWVSGRPENN
jgi:predicted aldo/keto reductase-like oxidoreductase